MHYSSLPQTELYRPISLHACSRTHKPYTVKATQKECTELAKRLQIACMNHFSFTYTVNINTLEKYIVMGYINAKIEQECVVTSYLVSQKIHSQFKEMYSIDDVAKHKDTHAYQKSVHDNRGQFKANDIQYLSNDMLDIGEVATQFLALEIDLYPRADDRVCHQVLKDFYKQNDMQKDNDGDQTHMQSAFNQLKKLTQQN